jgi:endonuclease-3
MEEGPMSKNGQKKGKPRSRTRPASRSHSRPRGLASVASSRKGALRTGGGSVRSRGRPLSASGGNLKKRASRIASGLLREYPGAKTALRHRSPLQLLIATILSAQCTDARVNLVTKELFKKYRTAADFADADLSQLEQEIHSLGFFRQKSRSIVQCCKDIVEKHGSRVPNTMEELTSLRGVGRKTANVVLANIHGRPAIIVDTHVKRLSLRLGLTRNTDPDRIEQDVMKLLPERDWTPFSDALILHGRSVCAARRPRCEKCVVEGLCPSSTI